MPPEGAYLEDLAVRIDWDLARDRPAQARQLVNGVRDHLDVVILLVKQLDETSRGVGSDQHPDDGQRRVIVDEASKSVGVCIGP